MSKEVPDHHDAELILKLYELRRETVMRESRNAINQKFWPKSFEDVQAVMKPDHPLNAAFRQTSSYWEMAYGMAKHGIVHADYLVENATEGFFLFAKFQPFLERIRKEISPTAFQNAEWASTQTAEGKRRFEMVSGRIRKMMESK